jgi:hypothetical protein
MALGKKTGGRDFVKGQINNPKGRAKIPQEVKSLRKLAFVGLEKLIYDSLFNSTGEEVEKKAADMKLHPAERWIANLVHSGSRQAQYRDLAFLLDRLIGPVQPLDVQFPQQSEIVRKKDFSEFCETAGYPLPFPKQVEMVQFGMVETDPRLLLGSRGYGKTDYVVILALAYDVYLNPESTNLIITKSKNRNTAIIYEIAQALEANGVRLSKQNSTCISLMGSETGKDYSVEALTIKSSFRGRHPKRIVMDDPVTEEDTSEAMRVLVKKKYDEAYKLSKNILVLGQPSHKFDLYSELRPILKKMEVPHGSIPELDADLEAMRLAGIDNSSIEMSYHLRIPSEGTTPFDNVKYLDKFPTGDSAVAFIDPSHEGGDYTAISIIKQYMQGIAVVGFCYKKAWNHCLDEIAPQLRKYNVKKLCFETNSLGDMPIDILRQTFKGVGIVGRRSTNNKHSRIMAAGAYAHMIHLSKESDKKYIDHVVQYEYKAKFDDCPDSLATGMEWVGLIRGKL